MSNEKKRAALWAPSLRGDLSPTPAQPTPQGVAEVSKSDAGYAAALYAKLYHEAKARVAELERDAARWSHAIIYGFPVRNQTGGGEKKWIAFSTGFDVEFGSNPITAIDAAIAATKEKAMTTEAMRAAFEADAGPMGFDMRRQEIAVPEPWAEYVDLDTGHRWAGWQAATLAERERAAEVCEEQARECLDGEAANSCECCADAIRNGEAP